MFLTGGDAEANKKTILHFHTMVYTAYFRENIFQGVAARIFLLMPLVLSFCLSQSSHAMLVMHTNHLRQ